MDKNKWLLVSCLQKSIRKGFVNLALNYAEELWNIDKNYLLYRLSIIAIEDVGLGNLELVHSFLKTELKKDNIATNGGEEYVMGIVKQLALSVKDRSACDLMEIAYRENIDLSGYSLEDIYLNKNENIVKRFLSGWEILGSKKFKNNNIINKEDNIEDYININKKLGVSENILEIIRTCYKVQNEAHFLSIGILSKIFEEELMLKCAYKVGDCKFYQHPEKLIANDLLIDGFDYHTKEGKSAIYDFIKKSKHLVPELKKYFEYSEIPRIIGKLMFKENGQKVDKRLLYPTAVNIYIKSQNFMNHKNYNVFMKLYEMEKNILLNCVEIKNPKKGIDCLRNNFGVKVPFNT